MRDNNALIGQMDNLLKQKIQSLNEIITLTKDQLNNLLEKEINIDDLNKLIEEKENNIQNLAELDNEIDLLIINLKKLNTGALSKPHLIVDKLDVIDKLIINLDASEKEVRMLFDNHIDKNKKYVKALRTNKNITSKYNQNMGNIHQSDMSYFLDKKK